MKRLIEYMNQLPKRSKILGLVGITLFIGILILASSHPSQSFFHVKTSAEKRNDSLANLFNPQIAQQKSIKLDTFSISFVKNLDSTVLYSSHNTVKSFTKKVLAIQTTLPKAPSIHIPIFN